MALKEVRIAPSRRTVPTTRVQGDWLQGPQEFFPNLPVLAVGTLAIGLRDRPLNPLNRRTVRKVSPCQPPNLALSSALLGRHGAG